MSDRVTLHHPNLPGQPITVSPRAVDHWKRAGWMTEPAFPVGEQGPELASYPYPQTVHPYTDPRLASPDEDTNTAPTG